MKIKDIIENKIEAETVLGIDMSSQSLAFSVFKKSDDWFLRSWGKIMIDGEDNFQKCGDIIGKFAGLVQTLSPELVVFESSTYVNNNAVMKQLSMVFGAASGVASNFGARVLDVPPITWQNYIGNPSFTKDEKIKFAEENPSLSNSQVKVKIREIRKQRNIDFVKEKFGIIVKDDDVADAICVGHYSVENYGV